MFQKKMSSTHSQHQPGTPTYFVSGPTRITAKEFEKHYAAKLNETLDKKAFFVVGDHKGTDIFTQTFLDSIQPRPHVVVFHCGNTPRFNVGNFDIQGGFKTKKERDKALTLASDLDIFWLTPLDLVLGCVWIKRRTVKIIERRVKKLQRDLEAEMEDQDKKWQEQLQHMQQECWALASQLDDTHPATTNTSMFPFFIFLGF